MGRAEDFLDAPEPAGNALYDGVRKAVTPFGGRITSTNGGRHNTGSAHYSGRAIDVGMARETPEQQETIKAQLEAAGYRVRDERTRPPGQRVWSGPHLHVESAGEPLGQALASVTGGSGGGGGVGQSSAEAFLDSDAPASVQDPVQTYRAARAARTAQPAPVEAQFPQLPAPVSMSGNGDIPVRAEDREVGRIYTDKRGLPRRWMGTGWASGDSARETTLGEFLGGVGVDAVQGLTRAPEALADLAGWLTGGESLLTPSGKQAFEDSRQTLEQMKPESYRAEQAAPVVERDASGGIVGLNLPSGESVAGTISQSLPQIPQMILTGGGMKTAAQNILPNAPKLAAMLGYGTANASMVAPGIAEQARTEAIQAGATPEQAQAAANKAMAMAVPLTMVTGGVGEGLAATQGAGAKSLISALVRGAATEAPAEAIEESGTSAIGDIAQGKTIDQADALESAVMAAFGGGLPGAAVAGTEYAGNRNRPAVLPADPVRFGDMLAQAQPNQPAVAVGGGTTPRQGDAPAAPPTPSVPVEKPEAAPDSAAIATPPAAVETVAAESATTPARDMAAATRSIDDRLAALDDTAAGQIDEAEVSALNTERQELDDLLREQDRAKREGVVQPLDARLSPEERATADARRTEIATTLERHRAARTAADQAQRLRTRLENTDSDAGLFEVAREINPTLGTPQADAFRTPTSAGQKINTAPEPVRIEETGTTPNVANVGDTPSAVEPNVGQLPRAPAASTPPASAGPDRLNIRSIAAQNTERGELDATNAAADVVSAVQTRLDRGDRVTMYRDGKPVEITGIERGMMQDAAGQRWGTMALFTEKGDANRIEFTSKAPAPVAEPGIPASPRADSQREPAPPAALEAPARQTSLKNAVTDAERVAEGRDPIIRAARKGNRETVDEAVRAIRETPSLGRETAQRLAEGGPVELKDEAVLLVHKVGLRKRRDAAAERALSPNVSEEARAIARREYDDAVQQIDEVDQAASRFGTESGRLLQLRKRMIADDYSMPALERKLRMVVNRDLRPAEQTEIKELAEKVATLQRKLDAVEGQQASAQVAEMLARLMKQAPGKNATLAQRRAAAAESKAALSAMSSARTPQRSIPEEMNAPYHRYTAGKKPDTGIGYMMFSENQGRVEGPYGKTHHTFDPAALPAGSVVDAGSAELKRLVIRAFEKREDDIQSFQSSAEDLASGINPDDIVNSVELWDAPELVEILWEEVLEPNGWLAVTTNDGAIVFDSDSVRTWPRGSQQSVGADPGKPGQARTALTERLGRGVVARLERAGVLVLDDRNGGTWDGTRIGIGNVAPENALGVLLHEVAHANMLDVLGEQGYERALRDLDALEAAGDPLALKAKRRAVKSGETGQRLDDERIAYMVEEATNAERRGTTLSERAAGLVRRVMSAFRRWAATSPVWRAMEAAKIPRPQLQPADFVAFASAGLDRMVSQARQPVGSADADRIRKLETELRTDYKTGIRNQRAFDEDADLGWKGVAAMDMDGLKKINDQLGHDAGDAVLRALANELAGAETTGARFYRLSGAGDEFAGRFKTQAEADRMMGSIQDALDGLQVDLDVADTQGRTRYYTYQGIGISYGTGADYGTADTAANQQKADRLAAGIREAPRTDGPSRRIRESAERAGGRRESDPPAVGPQRSIPEGEGSAPAGADPVAGFHLARMGAFHYADGARDVGDWTKRMETDLGAAAARYRSMLPDAFKASQAQATKPQKGTETVSEAVEAIGDQRRPRDVKRVVRAVVADGMRGEDAIIAETARALDMDDADVRTLFVQSESQARTLTEAQAELKDLRKQLLDANRPDAETQYQDQRARGFQRRIEELEERIAAGDFAKTEKTVRALDKRNTRLEFELQKAKSEFAFYALEKEFSGRSPLAKFTGYVGDTFSLLRAIKTSLDLSATLMQGGMMVVNRPYLLKHLKASIKAAWSEALEYEAIKTMQADPNYPRFKSLGLYLPGTDAQLERAEEAFAGRWIRKIPTKYGGGLLRASSRSYTTFLNLIRIETFGKMEQSMSLDGQFNEADSKALAKSINIMTGRGSLGRFEDAAGFFNIILFATRFTVSRFQVLAGLPFTNTIYGGGPRARKAIRKEYARYMLGVAAFYAFYALIRDPDDWEDDKSDDNGPVDNKHFVELDPRSVNFGAVRFGDNIFVNPLSGLSQATVFMTRLATGEEKKTMDGRIVPLRDNYRLTDYAPGLGQVYRLPKVRGGKTTLGEMGRFLRTKLSPAVGSGVSLMLGKNMIGDEYTWADVPADLTVPMSLGDLVDTLENQGVPRGMGINLAAFLGHARQYRKSDAEKRAEEENGIPGILGVGTAEGADDGP